jgi:hypothetical protein
MKLQLLHAKFTTDRSLRARFAAKLSAIIEADPASGFVPYMQNQGSDEDWVLDSNNNWWLHFPGEEDLFEIRYRYAGGTNSFESALFGWLSVMFSPLRFISY